MNVDIIQKFYMLLVQTKYSGRKLCWRNVCREWGKVC